MSRIDEELKTFGLKVATAEIYDVDSDFYRDIFTGVTTQMQKAGLAYAEYERACEAEVYCHKDMELLLHSLLRKGNALKTVIDCQPQNTEEKGERHLQNVRLLILDHFYQQCVKLFSPFIQIENIGLGVMPQSKLNIKGDVLEDKEMGTDRDHDDQLKTVIDLSDVDSDDDDDDDDDDDGNVYSL